MTPQEKNAHIAVAKTLDYLQKAILSLPNKEKNMREAIEIIWDKLYEKYK